MGLFRAFACGCIVLVCMLSVSLTLPCLVLAVVVVVVDLNARLHYLRDGCSSMCVCSHIPWTQTLDRIEGGARSILRSGRRFRCPSLRCRLAAVTLLGIGGGMGWEPCVAAYAASELGLACCAPVAPPPLSLHLIRGVARWGAGSRTPWCWGGVGIEEERVYCSLGLV